MVALSIAAACAGLFAGAAIYINAVEHPARLGCGNEVALREFGPSYRRATVMQGSLAVAAAPQVCGPPGSCVIFLRWPPRSVLVRWSRSHSS